MAAGSTFVVKILENNNYTNVRPLGSGAFGDVLSATSPNKMEVAIKVIKNDNAWVVEEQIWPELNHPRILPLLDVLSLPQIGLKLYVTPKLKTSLFDILQTADFRLDPAALNRVRKWLQNILQALDYLHTCGFAHMDLKTDNVLISSQDFAVLCDFSGLAIAELKVQRLCAPLEFRPPECFSELSSNGVDGIQFDIWTYGLLALGALAGQWPQMKMTYFQGWSWQNNVLPVLEIALNETNLEQLMKKSMTEASITKKDVENSLNFLTLILKFNPSERPSARELLKHSFVCKGYSTFTPETKEIAVACGDDVPVAPHTDTNSEKIENVVLPSPARARRGIGKRFKHWLVKKVKGLTLKKEGYNLDTPVSLDNFLMD